MASAQQILTVGPNTPQTVEPEALTRQRAFPAFPDWRRWNNYGIALFDQRQFAEAANVFARVAELDEKYRPFALTNRALALAEIDEWKDAAKFIDQALALDPKNMRALFQRGRIHLIESRLDEAQAAFAKVLEAYPRDRLTLQQLGELAKIRGDWKTARAFYERVIAIDPEDLSANYNLMLVYRRLRLNDLAKQQAALFKDLKDDPAATPVANNFLQRNPQMKGESANFHVHDLSTRSGSEILSED
jgi:tetratricopeptide (TPR) repeat protein